jgi:hypothetical protein
MEAVARVLCGVLIRSANTFRSARISVHRTEINSFEMIPVRKQRDLNKISSAILMMIIQRSGCGASANKKLKSESVRRYTKRGNTLKDDDAEG